MESIAIEKLVLHDLTEKFPAIPKVEFDALVKDIQENSIRDPLWVLNGNQIIDGRHRYYAALALGIKEVPVRYCSSKENPLSLIISSNLHRRQLSSSQRAMVAAQMTVVKHGGNKNIDMAPMDTKKAVEIFGVNEKYIRHAFIILNSGDTELINQVLEDKVPLYIAIKRLNDSKRNKKISSAPEKNSQELNKDSVQEDTIHKGNVYLELGKLKGSEMDMKAMVHHMGLNDFSFKDVTELIVTAGELMDKYKYSSVKNITYLMRKNS